MPEFLRLYRYMSAESALKTIESRAFRIGRLHELNDPFEWQLGVTGVVPHAEALAHSQMESAKAELSQQMGILSFSDTAEEPVLWSHYADKHRGVAFEVEHLLHPDSLFPVKYTNDRPVLDADRLHRDEGLRAYLLSLLSRLVPQKSPGWSYEREYRVFVALEACIFSNGHYFRPIHDYLTRVVLGYRCELEPSYVARCLLARGLPSTSVARARMCSHTYSIKHD